MKIEIRKVIQHETTTRFSVSTGAPILRQFHFYFVIVDGRIVDSFMKFRNAQRKAKSLAEVA